MGGGVSQTLGLGSRGEPQFVRGVFDIAKGGVADTFLAVRSLLALLVNKSTNTDAEGAARRGRGWGRGMPS